MAEALRDERPREATGARSVALAGRVAAPLLAGAFAVTMLILATGGPDCLEYLDWAHAAETGDITRIAGDARSPLGVPLTQWTHGPGMFFAIPYLLPDLGLIDADGPFTAARDFRLAGWLAALVLWGALLAVLRRASGRDGTIVALTGLAAFAGTHLGFYSWNHSSEILSYACLAVAAYWLTGSDAPRRADLAGVATAAGCLVLVRSQFAIYLPLIFGVVMWRLTREGSRNRSRGRALASTVLVALPSLTALAQVAWVNRWMTGSPWRSPYAFGDGAFRSLDLAHPEWLAVLVHPWHGLLVYHPLYGLAFALVLARLFRSKGPERLLLGGLVLTLAVHLWLQASWYCWWLGLWSLGNRGFGPAAVLLVPVVAMALRAARPAGRVALGGAVLACSVWSLLLMTQGHSNYLGWGELLEGQVAAARSFLPVLPAAAAAGLAAVWVARRRPDGARWSAGAAAFLGALLFDHLATLVAMALEGPAEGPWSLLLRVTMVALAPVVALVEPAATPSRVEERVRRAVYATALVLLFVALSGLFVRLAVRTEGVIAAGGAPGAGPVSRVQLDEVEECRQEYLRVDGFEDKKDALGRFLERAGRP